MRYRETRILLADKCRSKMQDKVSWTLAFNHVARKIFLLSIAIRGKIYCQMSSEQQSHPLRKMRVLFFIFHAKTLNRKYRYNSVIIQILSFHFALIYYYFIVIYLLCLIYDAECINGIRIDQRIWSNWFFRWYDEMCRQNLKRSSARWIKIVALPGCYWPIHLYVYVGNVTAIFCSQINLSTQSLCFYFNMRFVIFL